MLTERRTEPSLWVMPIIKVVLISRGTYIDCSFVSRINPNFTIYMDTYVSKYLVSKSEIVFTWFLSMVLSMD